MKKLFVLLVISLLSSNISLANSLKIIDGDTIVLNGEKIRFEGIDTPELKQTCLKDNEEVKCGLGTICQLVLEKKKIFIKGHLQNVLLMVKVCQNF